MQAHTHTCPKLSARHGLGAGRSTLTEDPNKRRQHPTRSSIPHPTKPHQEEQGGRAAGQANAATPRLNSTPHNFQKARERDRPPLSFSARVCRASRSGSPLERAVDRLQLAAAYVFHCRHPRAASGRHKRSERGAEGRERVRRVEEPPTHTPSNRRRAHGGGSTVLETPLKNQ